MEQLLAMQSAQSFHAILTNKEGWTFQNFVSFIIVTCTDSLRRAGDASVEHLIQNRVRLISSIIAHVRCGWRGLWGVLVYVIRLRFLTSLGLLRRRSKPRIGNGVGEVPPSSSPCPSLSSLSVGSSYDHSITFDIQNNTHEWSCILASPDLSYHRHSRFKTVRMSATVTSLTETLMDVAMIDVSCRMNSGEREEEEKGGGGGTPRFTVRFNHALSLEWTITKRRSGDGSVTFEKVLATVKPLYSDDEGGPPADTKNLSSIMHLVPVPRFAEASRGLISKHWNYTCDDDIVDMSVSIGNNHIWSFASHGTFTDVYECVVEKGMTFSSHTGRRRCFAELVHIICLHPDLNPCSQTRVDLCAPVRIVGTLFGLDIDVRCKTGLSTYVRPFSYNIYREYASGSDRGQMEVIDSLPGIKDFRKWITKHIRVIIEDDNDNERTANKRSSISKTSGGEEGCPSFEATVSSTSPTLHDNGALLRAWNCYLAKLEDDFERDRKTKAISSLEVEAEGVRLKTFSLHVSLKHVEVEKTNPEFLRYEERKRAVEEVMSRGGLKDGGGDANKKEGGGGSANEYALLQMVCNQPDRMITTVRTERVVDVDLINEFYRDISTVYLTERDEKNLMSCLYNFKHNRARLNRLGIPNKLGVMLNGPPGTGKTSMLTAIASYLEKDIYYLHLNELRTNGDLKDAFDHVFNKSAGGGMIVMEDVDAMTEVVKKRRPSSSETKNDTTGGPLTLEFFLNLLQGALTLDGSVFAATTNHLDALDPAFYRKGRFDVVVKMDAADHYQIRKMYSQFFSRPVPPDLLQRIPEKKIVPAEFIGQFAQYLLRSDIASDEEILEPFLE